MEVLDVYTIDDGVQKVVVHDVRLLSIFITLHACAAAFTDPLFSCQAYVRIHCHLQLAFARGMKGI